MLKAGEYADAVRADRRLTAARSVMGIPTYVLADQSRVHGAKRPAVLVEVLRRAARVRADAQVLSAAVYKV